MKHKYDQRMFQLFTYHLPLTTPTYYPLLITYHLLILGEAQVRPAHVPALLTTHSLLLTTLQVKHKYDQRMFQLFTEIFHCLPLCHVLGGKVGLRSSTVVAP